MALAYVASFASGDPDRIASHVTADFWNEHTSTLGRSGRGRVEYRSRLPAFLTDFAGLRYDVEDVVADGDRVVVAYTMRARWHGHDIAIRGVFRLRIEDGLVAKPRVAGGNAFVPAPDRSEQLTPWVRRTRDRMAAWQPILVSTTWVTPKSTATDARE